MAPSRVGVVSRTAPEAMATGPPTREPPHLPTSLAGRSPEKLPRLDREASGRGCRILSTNCQETFLGACCGPGFLLSAQIDGNP